MNGTQEFQEQTLSSLRNTINCWDTDNYKWDANYPGVTIGKQ